MIKAAFEVPGSSIHRVESTRVVIAAGRPGRAQSGVANAILGPQQWQLFDSTVRDPGCHPVALS